MNEPLDTEDTIAGSDGSADRLVETLLRYLDGELTAQEQEEVERMLGERHDARETFVELCLAQSALAEVAPTLSAAVSSPTDVCACAPGTDLEALADGRLFGPANKLRYATIVPLSPPIFWTLCAALVIGLSLLLTYLWRPLLPGGSTTEVGPIAAGFDSHFIATLAQVTHCRWYGDDAPFQSGARLSPAELGLQRGIAEILFDRGTRVILDGPARFTPLSEHGGYLRRGRLVARTFHNASGFAIQTPAAIIVDQGAEFGVWAAEDGATEIHVFAGAVELAARQDGQMDPPRYMVRAHESRRIEPGGTGLASGTRGRVAEPIPFAPDAFTRSLPRTDYTYPASLISYWNFDEQGGPAGDLVGRNDGAMQGVTRSAGLVGRGAVRFDDRPGQMVHVGSGDGSFSCEQGITIEALFVSRFTPGDELVMPAYDEIFRKDDGRQRILLSFQDDGDSNARFSQPAVVHGPVLSFGLNIAGEYHELDMPLDGQEGRPSLAELTDGAMHHVVATYDAVKGEKAIYLDGVKRFAFRYPPGSPLATGGDRPAAIGNHAGHPWESFHGVLDEVAIYNASLDAAEIQEHYRRAKLGQSYFTPTSMPAAPGASTSL